ncbi:HflC protein [candidate division KSB1 bacterium RBG_16_48_16]|nr:MAG: HflC protein [candidate division KSB1 bacterium RBG_16_48_16]
MKRRIYYLYIPLVLLAIILVSDAVFIVDETKQVIITQFGEPIGQPITSAGLHAKIPFIQKTTFFEKRIMEWDGDRNQIPTQDKKYLLVDTFARWRIVDPLKFYQSVNNERNALGRLDDIIDGITRDFISENMLIEVVRNSNREMTITSEEETSSSTATADSLTISLGREFITDAILQKVRQTVPQYGIQIEDIRIKQVNYIDEVRNKVFDRMISERKRIAQLYRSEGQGKKAEIEGQRQKELQRISSEAYKRAEQIKGDGDAKATEIYANAYSKDADFYSFQQTLESYRATIDTTSTVILSTDSDYLKYLKTIK